MDKRTSAFQATVWEKISYGLYFAGQNFNYVLVSTFFSLFLLNKGLDEGVIAALLLVPKVWDAVNDPIFGVLMDRIRFRRGRFLPWLRISWVLISASTLFIFLMPDSLSERAMIAWAVTGYVLWDTSYTMCDAPIFALATAMSTDVEERTNILAIGRLFATVAAIAGTLGVEALYMPLGWKRLAMGLSALCLALMFPVLVVGKERSHPRQDGDPGLKAMARAFLSNKYLMVFFTSYFLIAVTMFIQDVIPIFAQYVLGSTTAGTVMIGICTIPMVIFAALLPAMTARADKFRIYVASILLFAAGSVIQFLFGYGSTTVLYLTTFLRSVGFSGYSVLVYMFVPDLVEYGHYTTGERQEGICFSMQTFVTKLTGAIVASFSLLLLKLAGFSAADADPVTGVVGETAGRACFAIFTLVPVIGSVLGALMLMKWYRLRDADVQLMSRCNNGEISREECDRRLTPGL